MIVYKNTAKGFQDDVDTNKISDFIEAAYATKYGRKVSQSEKRSWTNSMEFMGKAVRRAEVHESCGILVEYNLPATSKRIDFLIAGEDDNQNKNFIIIELKQWETAEATDKDGIVSTFLGGGRTETTHPSYQAASYKMFFKDYNENVETGVLVPHACAYLHNYRELNPEPLKSSIYKTVLDDAPIYFKEDYKKLEDFIRKYVRCGNGEDILYKIESGKIRPSKKLIDHVGKMYEGNQEFILLDEQKVAYETARSVARKEKEKSVVIIKGGPGTGKSVISVNLLGGLLKDELNTVFVAPNSSFRNVMIQKLARNETKTRLNNLFKGSAGFVDTKEDTFDVIIVDEAHRLKNGSAYQYMGDNQAEDIIKAARTTILFIDDNQMIRPEDIGSVKEVRKIAQKMKAKIYEIELQTQFRCAGSEGYLNWLDHTLQIKDTGNFDGWDRNNFEFRIFDDPNKLREAISTKDKLGFNSRILAGYAWDWTSEKEGNKDSEIHDVVVSEFDFSMPWNSRKVGTTWAINPSGISQVGCIHTSQGLEFDYVGVLIGSDLRFDPNATEYLVDWKSYKDSSGKKGLKEKPDELKKLVKNIYKVLMSRGMKGCYVYFVDKDVEKYFKSRLPDEAKVLPFIKNESNKLLHDEEVPEDQKYKKYLPVYSLKAAAGGFRENYEIECMGWKKVDSKLSFGKDFFIAQVVGKSMEPTISDGSYCVFRLEKGGSRNGLVVLVESSQISDPEHGNKYTIKRYHSEKENFNDGTWRHKKITLSPDNKDFKDIILEDVDALNFKVIAEFVCCL